MRVEGLGTLSYCKATIRVVTKTSARFVRLGCMLFVLAPFAKFHILTSPSHPPETSCVDSVL